MQKLVSNKYNHSTKERSPDRSVGVSPTLYCFCNKNYELPDWLGNVRVVINDRKTPVNTGNVTVCYKPQVTSVTDYYSFGSEIFERTYSHNVYRFGFNGKEDLHEQRWYQDYGARFYHKALGRFVSPDPLIVKERKYAWLTPYQFASLNPVQNIDIDGKEGADFKFDMYQRMKDAKVLKVTYRELQQQEVKAFAEAGLNMLPIVGDAMDVYDAYQAIKNKYWIQAGISIVSLIPFSDIATKPIKKLLKESAEGLTIKEIKHIAGSGTFEKVAVIGTDMKKRVRPFAEKLKAKGINVEVFEPSEEARREYNNLIQKYGGSENIPVEETYKSKGFKENVMWRQKLRDEGYDILDIGASKESVYYKMERDPVWNKTNKK